MDESAIVFKHGTTDGPSGVKLVDALLYAYSKSNPVTVSFTLNGGVRLRVQIISVAHLDGSGHMFDVSGKVVAVNKKLPGSLWSKMNHDNFVIKISHNIMTRHGFVYFYAPAEKNGKRK